MVGTESVVGGSAVLCSVGIPAAVGAVLRAVGGAAVVLGVVVVVVEVVVVVVEDDVVVVVVMVVVIVVVVAVVAWSIVSNFTDPVLHAASSANANCNQ